VRSNGRENIADWQLPIADFARAVEEQIGNWQSEMIYG